MGAAPCRVRRSGDTYYETQHRAHQLYLCLLVFTPRSRLCNSAKTLYDLGNTFGTDQFAVNVSLLMGGATPGPGRIWETAKNSMLIAVEGIDAAGKNTQARLLRERVESAGLNVGVLSFPRYGETLFAKSIADYLNGKFGTLASVDPHFSSLLYAGDRFESRNVLMSLSRSNDVLILDRYVASNLAYQAARIPEEHRREFISWLARIEYEIYDLPRAEVTLYLDVPAESSSKMLRQKGQRSYTEQVADIYERDLHYLATCRSVYQNLASLSFESDWRSVECIRPDGAMRTIEDVSELIWINIHPVIRAAFNLRVD